MALGRRKRRQSDRLAPETQSVFRRLIKNVGWIAGSRGFNAVVSIGYMAFAARALGPAQFGVFAIILTYAQLIANFVQFQSWKGVIRYGSLHCAAERPDRLKRLFGYTAALDFGSAIVGSLIAIVAVPFMAPLFHWSPHEQTLAAVFAGVLLLTTGATPMGILRLFDRFDITAYCEAIGPLVRLAGSIVAWTATAGPETFLIIWAVAGILQAAAQWAAVFFINGSRLSLRPTDLRLALAENERIWPFMLQTNISSAISMFWLQLGTLAVGAYVGPAQAGAFRLARRLSKGIVRPIQPVTQALYPELTRLVAADDHAQLRKVVIRCTLVSMALAIGIVAFVGVGGREILRLIAGKEFEFAYPLLFLLSIATAIDFAGFALEPVQNAHGKSWNVLRAKIIAAIIYAGLLAVLLPRMGGEGAAIAAIICSGVIFAQLAYLAYRTLHDHLEPTASGVSGQLQE